MSEWVAVKDRLPHLDDPNGGDSDFVLISDGREIGVGSYQGEYFIEDDPDRYEGQALTYSSEMWYCEGGVIDEPTHWMPLPNLPKEL